MIPLEGNLCAACGEKMVGGRFEIEASPLCAICRRARPQFNQAAAYGAYDGALRDLIHIFKYQRVLSAGPVLGSMLGHAFAKLRIVGPLLMVPVPLWPGKRRARGFNQAEDIARSFLRAYTGSGIQLCTGLLIRTRETVSQTGLTRHQRRANLKGAFSTTKPEALHGQTVVLVDDVMTTGATAGECARVLLRAGAKQIFVATVARATREVESVTLGAPLASAAATVS
jgi:ComF family protein